MFNNFAITQFLPPSLSLYVYPVNSAFPSRNNSVPSNPDICFSARIVKKKKNGNDYKKKFNQPAK